MSCIVCMNLIVDVIVMLTVIEIEVVVMNASCIALVTCMNMYNVSCVIADIQGVIVYCVVLGMLPHPCGSSHMLCIIVVGSISVVRGFIICVLLMVC